MLKQRGFSLLELLVVMVIIGLLVGYVGPKYYAELDKAEIKAAKRQMKGIETALDIYRLDLGYYPNQEEGLIALMENIEGSPNWKGPYLKKQVPNDPWGQPYQYRIPGEQSEYDLYSFGKDRKAGGTDDNADIFNR